MKNMPVNRYISLECEYGGEEPVIDTGVLRIPPGIEEKLERMVRHIGYTHPGSIAESLIHIQRAVHDTKEKFLHVLECWTPEEKMRQMETACPICDFYKKRTETRMDRKKYYESHCPRTCLYYERCRTRFNNTGFRNAREMDIFAMEEAMYCIILEASISTFMDKTLGMDTESLYTMPQRGKRWMRT